MLPATDALGLAFPRPGTFDAARLESYLGAGVTRVSLGVQSFNDELLKGAGRAHGLREVEEAITLLNSITPRLEYSVDLIGGLPHQRHDTWQHSLTAAATCGARHVSVYDLQVERGTSFGKWYTAGSAPLPSDQGAADMFREASRELRAHNFEHYEVSSYAQPGSRCVHNRAYWRNEHFWAFGLGATSHVQNRRLARPRTMGGYAKYVAALEEGGWTARQLKLGVHEPAGSVEALQTQLMLALRTDEGIDVDSTAAAYGRDGLGEIIANGCVEAASEIPASWLDASNAVQANGYGVLRLSDPEGFLFSNEAIAILFAKIDVRLEAARGLSA